MTDDPVASITRYLGVDVGEARVGLALSDESAGFALPHDTAAASEAVEAILDLVERYDTALVIGWPLEMSGAAGRATHRVEKFIDKLEQQADRRGLDLTIYKRDERLTTGLANKLLDEADVWGKKRKGVVDQVAAVQILQAFLEERARGADEEQ